MPHRLKLLIDDLVSTIPASSSINRSSSRQMTKPAPTCAEPFDIKATMDVPSSGMERIQSSGIDAIQIPFGSADSSIAFVLTTVSERHWENEAVFKPRPKRPRSCGDRCCLGLRSHDASHLAARLPSSPAVVEDDHQGMLTGHIADDVDGACSSGKCCCRSDQQSRSFERVPKVPHRFRKGGPRSADDCDHEPSASLASSRESVHGNLPDCCFGRRLHPFALAGRCAEPPFLQTFRRKSPRPCVRPPRSAAA